MAQVVIVAGKQHLTDRKWTWQLTWSILLHYMALQLLTGFSQKRVELAGHAVPQVERRKQRRRDSQPEFARTDFEVEARVPPRQRRRCETEVLQLKTLPV